MNNTFQATDGLSASTFPDTIPTYTGHYHKPHVVGQSNIRYVGSPYQGAQPTAIVSFPVPLPSGPFSLHMHFAYGL